MLKILLFLILSTVPSFALLTPGNIPVTKSSGHGTSPTSEDSDITDVVGTSVSVGVPLYDQGHVVCNISGNCPTVSGSVNSVTASSPLSSTGGTSPNITLNSSGITSLGTLTGLTTSGNVGIGTVTAPSLLTVGSTGGFKVDSFGNIASIAGDSGANFESNTLTLDSSGAAEILNGNLGSSSSLYVQGGQGTNSYLVLQSGDEENTNGYIQFQVNAGNTVAMQIQDNSGIANVGIGSLFPGQKLDVNGTIRMTGFTLTGNGASAGNVMVTNNIGIGTWMSPSSIGATGGSSGTNYWTTGNVGINTTNNVGIGSVNPGQALDVQGTVRSSYFVGNGAGITGLSGSISGLTTGDIIKASSATAIVNTVSLTETSAGNIGIGSATPGQILDVQGTVRTSIAFQAGTGSASITGLNGNVGIGSTAPSQALDVNGTVRMTGFSLPANGVGSGYVMVTNNLGIGTWMSPSSIGATGGGVSSITVQSPLSGGTITSTGNVGIGTALGNISTFGATGNVGIGSSTPGQLLDVQGTIRGLGEVINGVGTTNFTTNVGIGSASPGQVLDVLGTVRAQTFQFLGIGTASPTRLCVVATGIQTCP